MDYYERLRFNALERQCLEPPDKDDIDYEERGYELEDILYDRMIEECCK